MFFLHFLEKIESFFIIMATFREVFVVMGDK